MSSLQLLRILGMMLVTVCWFLCAWTVGVLQNRQRNVPILITSETVDGQSFTTCSLDCWDYMMSVGESGVPREVHTSRGPLSSVEVLSTS